MYKSIKTANIACIFQKMQLPFQFIACLWGVFCFLLFLCRRKYCITITSNLQEIFKFQQCSIFCFSLCQLYQLSQNCPCAIDCILKRILIKPLLLHLFDNKSIYIVKIPTCGKRKITIETVELLHVWGINKMQR